MQVEGVYQRGIGSWVLYFALAALVLGIAVLLYSLPPQVPVVVKYRGCSYYELYHSRMTEHYEYIHCDDCTNRTHILNHRRTDE